MGKYTSDDINNKLEELQNLDYVSDRNHELLQEFISHLRADDDVGIDRQYKYLSGFKTLLRAFIDYPLDEATKDQIRDSVAAMQASDYSDWTTRDYKVYLNKFYRTLYESEVDRPDRVKRILDANFMTLTKKVDRKKEIEALTPEEVMAMVEAADKTRNKLLPLFLAETGARIGEVIGNDPSDTVKLKHVDLRQKYVEVTFYTLKNQEKDYRKLQLTRCAGLLQDWLEKHPRGDDPEAFLFVNIQSSGGGEKGECMTSDYISDILNRLADKAGIDKPIFPHVFRHTSATNKSWPADRLMYWHGWGDLATAQSYTHEDEDRMREARLADEGINEEDNGDTAMDMQECGRCGESAPPTASYCPSCSLALDKDVARQEKQVKEAGEKITRDKMDGMTDEDIKKIKERVLQDMQD